MSKAAGTTHANRQTVDHRIALLREGKEVKRQGRQLALEESESKVVEWILDRTSKHDSPRPSEIVAYVSSVLIACVDESWI